MGGGNYCSAAASSSPKMKGAFWITWKLDARERRRLQCNPRTPVSAAGDKDIEWKIPDDQLELRRDLDAVDSQLARLSEQSRDFDHALYAECLVSAAVVGLDGSAVPFSERDALQVKSIADPGPILVALARERIDAMRNDLLMNQEQAVKDGVLSLLAVRAIAFATLPWLLLLVPLLPSGWLWIPLVLAASGAFANGFGSRSKGSIAHCPWLLFPGILGVTALAIWNVFHDADAVKDWPPLQNYVIFWDAVMLGVWLAVGSRLRKMQFAELVDPNSDKFQIWVRLLRAGTFALLLGLLLSFGPDTVIFGISARALFENPGRAFVFGLVFGLAELFLPQAAGAKAEGLFKAVNSEDPSRRG